jgi:hypothetical protein
MSRHSIKRIEHVVAEINAYLVVVAIGLATLDLVLLVALEVPLVPTPCADCSSISSMPESDLGTTPAFASLGQ